MALLEKRKKRVGILYLAEKFYLHEGVSRPLKKSLAASPGRVIICTSEIIKFLSSFNEKKTNLFPRFWKLTYF